MQKVVEQAEVNTQAAAQSFRTEFGHRIPFVPPYFKRNKLYTQNVGKEAFAPPSKVLATGTISLPHCAKTFVAFSTLALFMLRWGLFQRYKRSIDLGGGNGLLSALTKAAGISEHTTSIDLVSHSMAMTPLFFEGVVNSFIRNPVSLNEKDPSRSAFLAGLQRAKWAQAHFADQEPMIGLCTALPHEASVDQYLHADIFDAAGTYDLVTSNSVFDLLDLDRALAKVAQLLAKDGVFVCADDYWWWPINSSAIVGHFPYVVQRLSFDDLTRYMAEFHPANCDSLRAQYFSLHGGVPAPTINDWIAVARRHGLRVVAVERIVPTSHYRAMDCPPFLLKQPWFDPDEVLRDIHYRKPDVVLEDLLTVGIRIAMIRA